MVLVVVSTFVIPQEYGQELTEGKEGVNPRVTSNAPSVWLFRVHGSLKGEIVAEAGAGPRASPRF